MLKHVDYRPVKVVRKNGYAVCVEYDGNSESPREWDNLGKLFLRTRSLTEMECTEDEMANAPVRLPVYKYEHSGISLSTDNNSYPFNDRWDSCLAGYIVATRDDILKEFGGKRITASLRSRVEEILKSELEIYNQWINGECYGFRVFSGVDDDVPDCCIDECTEEDSCWGFYSVEDALADGLAMVPEVAMA